MAWGLPLTPSSTDVLERNRAIPLLTLSVFVAYKRGENLPKTLKSRGYFVHQKPYVLITDYIYVFSLVLKNKNSHNFLTTTLAYCFILQLRPSMFTARY